MQVSDKIPVRMGGRYIPLLPPDKETRSDVCWTNWVSESIFQASG